LRSGANHCIVSLCRKLRPWNNAKFQDVVDKLASIFTELLVFDLFIRCF